MIKNNSLGLVLIKVDNQLVNLLALLSELVPVLASLSQLIFISQKFFILLVQLILIKRLLHSPGLSPTSRSLAQDVSLVSVLLKNWTVHCWTSILERWNVFLSSTKLTAKDTSTSCSLYVILLTSRVVMQSCLSSSSTNHLICTSG